jgi:hypothetical protein
MKGGNARLAGLFAAAAVTILAACSDSGTTQPRVSPNASQSGFGGKNGDTTVTGSPADSSGHPSTPVASFTLDVQVLGGSLNATDTLLTGPVGGVRVDVYAQTYTYTGGNGADTVQINKTLVTSGLTDGTGHVVFANLNGQDYLLNGTPPDGSGYRSFNGFVPRAYSDKIKMTFVLQKQ